MRLFSVVVTRNTLCLVSLYMLFGCYNRIPQKINVLSIPQPEAKTNSALPNNTTPEQTKFTRPKPFISRDSIEKRPGRNVADRVKMAPKYPVTDSTDNSVGLLFGFPKSTNYYKYLVDSIQFHAKPIYEKGIDLVIEQLSTSPSQKKNPAANAQWYAAVNFNIRKPNFVILHHTGQNSAAQTLFTFSISRTQTSAHYVVGRDGTVFQMLNDYVRAWHAGSSKWGNITNMNSCSLGIEIDNNGNEPYPDEQIKALIKLLVFLKNEYNIPQANFIAHSDIAPGRKVDPSRLFPWKTLADAGLGYFYNANDLLTPTADFNALMALRSIGYDISSPANAIRSFKLHYLQNDISGILSEYDKKIVYNLYRKLP